MSDIDSPENITAGPEDSERLPPHPPHDTSILDELSEELSDIEDSDLHAAGEGLIDSLDLIRDPSPVHSVGGSESNGEGRPQPRRKKLSDVALERRRYYIAPKCSNNIKSLKSVNVCIVPSRERNRKTAAAHRQRQRAVREALIAERRNLQDDLLRRLDDLADMRNRVAEKLARGN